MTKAKEVQEAADEEGPIEEKFDRRKWVSSGSTLLNLAISGNPFCGFRMGCYYFLVGDSTSGKTFLSMTSFAEAAVNPRFKSHRLIYDDVEGGALMDIRKFFGDGVADRLEAPGTDDDGEDYHSNTIEDFYFHIDDAIEKGEPFIYVLDSMDGLTSKDEVEKFEETKKAARAGKTVAGSYGDGKAKKNSAGMRRVARALRDTDSILIVISQTRDDLGFGFKKKTRSGGHALKFYATVEMWSSVGKQIKKSVKGKDRVVGHYIDVGIEKNRHTGTKSQVSVPIYPSYGIDDLGSCVDYLVDEGVWTRKGSSIQADGLDLKGHREALIEKIEEAGKEKELQALVGKTHREIQDESAVSRKRRY